MDGAAGLCLAFGLTTLGAYLIINYLPFDSFSIAWDRRQVVYLAIYFRAATVPFLCSGLLVGSRLVTAGHANGCAHFVYAANLIGSAFGCVASRPALAVVLFTLLLFSGLGSLTVNRWRLVVGLAGLVLLVGLYPVVLQPFSTLALRLSE